MPLFAFLEYRVGWGIEHSANDNYILGLAVLQPILWSGLPGRMERDNKVDVIYCRVSNKTTREAILLRKLKPRKLFSHQFTFSLVANISHTQIQFGFCGLEFRGSWLSSHFQFLNLCKRKTNGPAAKWKNGGMLKTKFQRGWVGTIHVLFQKIHMTGSQML